MESIANLLARGLHPGSAEGAQLMLEALAHQAQTDFLAADLESYVLGDLAGYLLERQGVDWLARMAQGETPLAMLLESVTPVAAPADEAMERRIRKAIAAANRQFLQRFHDPAGGHLLVPNRAMSGSFEVSNSYRLTTQPGTIEVGVSAGFALDDGRIDLRAATVATQLKSACGREDLYWIVALAPAELEKTAEGRGITKRSPARRVLALPSLSRSTETPWTISQYSCSV